MILAIDIGNTTTNCGLFERGRLASQWSIPTRLTRTPQQLVSRLKGPRLRTISQIVICSVVPRMVPKMSRALRARTEAPIRIVGRNLKVPLKNRYRYPKQVGMDRLVGAYAAWRAYGAPRGRHVGRHPERARQGESRGGRDCIVVDFGTAITIDVVTKSGAYLGGVIAPGLEISLEALAAKTALLPRVALRKPPELLGRDTANSIRSGILYGCAALCDGLITRLRQHYAPRAAVVATGGASSLLARHTRTIDHLRPHLVLEGLYKLSIAELYT